MPLLKKKEFRLSSSGDGFTDSEKVFHCLATNEIFRSYDEFCARVILCNSMVWTCKFTGKSGLTYSEAVECETNAKNLFKDFPSDLRIPILFISTKTNRTNFTEMVDDVYGFTKDRYFIGENVEASFTDNKWHLSHLLQVIAPSPEKLKKARHKERNDPPADLYHYEVEQLDSGDPDLSEVMMVNHERIRRKNRLSREKIKLFLKQYVQQNDQRMFVIKPSVLEKFGIHKMRFDQVFDGPVPHFGVSKKLTKNGKSPKQGSLVPFLTSTKKEAESKNKPNAKSSPANSIDLIEKMRKQQEEYQQKREEIKQKKIDEKIRQRQEKHRISNMLKEWHKPRNDLELEDHKVLPVATPVRTQIPEEHLGDVFTILEFTKNFKKILSVNNFFSGGLTFEALERALSEKEVAGPLMDLIQMFLLAIFNLQVEESSQINTKLDLYAADTKGIKYSSDISFTDATIFATSASSWCSKHHGMTINSIPLSAVTTSEVLRLHLLSSGARIHETGTRWRYQYRGGYLTEDDPGLHFRLKYPHILSALAVNCVTELPTGDIMKIIDCLMAQLLTYPDVRDQIEDELEKSRQAKSDYKTTQAVERKLEQEFITSRHKLNKENKENQDEWKEQMDTLVKRNEDHKAENEKKLSKYLKLANQHQIHLGQDRAFRKYLKLESVPGFFINFEEDYPGYCYEECIPHYPNLANAGDTEILAHLRKVQEETNTSDKENTLSANNIVIIDEENDAVKDDISLNTSFNDRTKLLICNSNPETCIVHSASVPKEKWSFYHTPEQVTELIESLNPRGIYECELKQYIASNKNKFLNLVENTPSILNIIIEQPKENENSEETSKNLRPEKKLKHDDVTLGYPKELGTSLILQYLLVENILDLEEKIFAGNLGSVKVKNRNTWRTALANHHYDKVDTTIKNIINVNNQIKDNDKSSRPATPEVTKDYQYQDPGKPLESVLEKQSLDNDAKSTLSHSDEHKIAIQTIACALAQIAEGVDSRYLKKPLGNVQSRNSLFKISDILYKWESSLLSSTSYCQIFLHYNSLDTCILWTRSALVARCTVCKRARNEDTMLVCENCNGGQHLHCHKPKLKKIPKGEWFCNTCRKQKEAEEKLKNPSPVKRRRIFREDEESSDDNKPQNNKKRKRFEESLDDSELQNIILRKRKTNGKELLRKSSRRKRVRVLSISSDSSESESKASDSEEENENDEPNKTDNDAENSNTEKENEDGNVTEDKSESNEDNVSSDSDEGHVNGTTSDTLEAVGVNDTNEDPHKNNAIEDTEHLSNKVNGMPNGDIADEGILNSENQVELCEKCWLGGTLLCCDNCPDLYHLECATPPLRRVPRGEWFCHKCKSSKKKEDTDTSRRSIRRDDLPLNNVPLQEVLGEVMKQDFAWPFLRPVNKNEVPDYYEIVQNPMDFGTIKYKLNMGNYKFDSDLMADVVLLFANCNLYNNENDEVYQCGVKVLDYFVEKCRELGLHLPHKLESKEVFSEDSEVQNPVGESEIEDPSSTESDAEKPLSSEAEAEKYTIASESVEEMMEVL